MFPTNRHYGLQRLDDDLLRVLLTRRFDRPERVMVVILDLSNPDDEWRANPHSPETVLWSDRDYGGGDLPLETSGDGAAYEPMRALRDSAVVEGNGRTYPYYAVAGEQGMAGAEIYERR
ncbi:hypothetical protein [Halomarina oriensis]|uniref:Uncharacterized protein n=1 Tax=Halomarina oriensis TaxID=671145 RepID=A0A6B0GJC6_9EURY|nr:hypothetical protein [Halomarina oriensis]MWG35016.1 hypothetical protein [Halomarina oriensis]